MNYLEICVPPLKLHPAHSKAAVRCEPDQGVANQRADEAKGGDVMAAGVGLGVLMVDASLADIDVVKKVIAAVDIPARVAPY